MQHPDQKYIDALLNNDVILLEELYQRFSGKIKWMVLQNHGNETDAADIFQDALLSIFTRAKTQNFILTCPFEAFLYPVCKNKWMNELTKRKTLRVTFQDIDGYNSTQEDSLTLAEEGELKQARKDFLINNLTKLGESCRQLLLLSWSGKPMDEVATILKVSYGYARKRKSECMAKLVMLIQQSSEFDSLKW